MLIPIFVPCEAGTGTRAQPGHSELQAVCAARDDRELLGRRFQPHPPVIMRPQRVGNSRPGKIFFDQKGKTICS